MEKNTSKEVPKETYMTHLEDARGNLILSEHYLNELLELLHQSTLEESFWKINEIKLQINTAEQTLGKVVNSESQIIQLLDELIGHTNGSAGFTERDGRILAGLVNDSCKKIKSMLGETEK